MQIDSRIRNVTSNIHACSTTLIGQVYHAYALRVCKSVLPRLASSNTNHHLLQMMLYSTTKLSLYSPTHPQYYIANNNCWVKGNLRIPVFLCFHKSFIFSSLYPLFSLLLFVPYQLLPSQYTFIAK